MIRTVSVLFAAGIVLGARVAHADPSPEDVATARSLFFEARQKMADQHWAEACPALEESERLDPGRGTEFNLADCYEHIGRIASAWTLFDEVASASAAAHQPAHEARAHERAERILPRVPELTVLVAEESRVPGLEVTRDGVLLPQGEWSIATKLDPGAHVVAASAPGRRPWQSTVELDEKTWASVEVPPLERETRDDPVTFALPAVADVPAPARPSEKRKPRTIAFVLGGTGLASLAAGGIFTALSLDARADAKPWCSTTTNACTSQRGVDARSAAIGRGNAATGLFIAGAVLVAAGAVVGVSF